MTARSMCARTRDSWGRSTMTDDDRRPWWREPYVWLLIGLPLSAVIGGIATLVLAIESSDGLVVDDYYRRGLEINRTLDRDRHAQRYGLDATFDWLDQGRTLRVTLDANSTFVAPRTIHTSLLNATRAGLDQVVDLTEQSPFVYQGAVRPLVRGRWYIQIEAENWRLLEPVRVN